MAMKKWSEMTPGEYGKYVRHRAQQIRDAEARRNFRLKKKQKIRVITNSPGE